MVHEPVQIDDETNPEKLKATLTENQQYWTNRWADQMNYRYWKDRCAGRDDRRGRPGPPALLRGDHGLQDGRLPDGRREVPATGLKIWDKLLKGTTTTATTTSTRRTPA